MKLAALALRDLLVRLARGIDLEGGFLLAGAGLLAYGASYYSPAAPFLILGGACTILGMALAISRSR